MEDLNFYYANYSRCVWLSSPDDLCLVFTAFSIYNDVITLRKGSSYM